MNIETLYYIPILAQAQENNLINNVMFLETLKLAFQACSFLGSHCLNQTVRATGKL